jgi:hypothetical protein
MPLPNLGECPSNGEGRPCQKAWGRPCSDAVHNMVWERCARLPPSAAWQSSENDLPALCVIYRLEVYGSVLAVQARRRTTIIIIARIEAEGRERPSNGGEGVARSRHEATAIEGTSRDLGAKLEGAAVGAYAEKYRFAPGFSVRRGELEKHLIASRSRRLVTILRSCMQSQPLCAGSYARLLEIGTLAAAVRATCRPPKIT